SSRRGQGPAGTGAPVAGQPPRVVATEQVTGGDTGCRGRTQHPVGGRLAATQGATGARRRGHGFHHPRVTPSVRTESARQITRVWFLGDEGRRSMCQVRGL